MWTLGLYTAATKPSPRNLDGDRCLGLQSNRLASATQARGCQRNQGGKSRRGGLARREAGAAELRHWG